MAELKEYWNFPNVVAYLQDPEKSKPLRMVPEGFGSRTHNLCGRKTFKGM